MKTISEIKKEKSRLKKILKGKVKSYTRSIMSNSKREKYRSELFFQIRILQEKVESLEWVLIK